MEIKRSGSRPSRKGPAENFTGSVRIDPLFDPPGPARAYGALVDVRTRRAHGLAYPSARADVDRHLRMRLDAVLGEPKEEIRPGDVIWCPPGKKHWHGATATTAMSHIAIVEKLNGKAVDWMEKVSDEQYRAALSAE